MVNNEKSDYRNKIKELTGLKKTAYEVFKANSAHIEIDFHQGLHKVYFMIQPACHYLDDNKKKSFQDTSKRETNNEKITFLMLEAPKYFDIMDHMSRLMKKCAIANQDTFKYVRDICLILALTLNIFIFVLYEVDVTNGVGIIVTRWSGTQTALYILGGLHILFSVLMIILWFVVDGKIDLMNQWRDKILFYKKNLNKSNESSSEYEMKVFELLNRPIIELKKEDKIEIIKLYNDKNGYKYSQPTLEYFSYTIYFILYGSGFQIYVIYILMSVVALWRDVVILYSLHLLDIIRRSDTLGNVIKAVAHNKIQLIQTAFLGLVLLYFYALFGFLYVDETFWTTSVDPPENMCYTMIQCFATVASLGPRSSGSVGDVLQYPSYATGKKTIYYVRWLYDVSIFFIVNIICMKLIFGIIIDTFAELRDKKNNDDYDRNNVCFICGLEKYEFDKNADGFENHKKRDHKMWNYLYFMYNIKKKDPTEYNGIESYVSEMMEKDDIKWFPQNQSIILEKSESNDTIEDKIDSITEQIKSIEEKLNQHLAT